MESENEPPGALTGPAGQQEARAVPRPELEADGGPVLPQGAWQLQVAPGAQKGDGHGLRPRAGEGDGPLRTKERRSEEAPLPITAAGPWEGVVLSPGVSLGPFPDQHPASSQDGVCLMLTSMSIPSALQPLPASAPRRTSCTSSLVTATWPRLFLTPSPGDLALHTSGSTAGTKPGVLGEMSKGPKRHLSLRPLAQPFVTKFTSQEGTRLTLMTVAF